MIPITIISVIIIYPFLTRLFYLYSLSVHLCHCTSFPESIQLDCFSHEYTIILQIHKAQTSTKRLGFSFYLTITFRVARFPLWVFTTIVALPALFAITLPFESLITRVAPGNSSLFVIFLFMV